MPSLIQFNAAMYFDRDAVIQRLGKVKASALGKLGAYTRRRARSSIKPRRQKSIAELSPEEADSFKIAKRIAQQKGRPAPKRPLEASKPGQAPRSVTGVLKRGIEFAAEPDRDNVVIGAAIANATGREAPEVLEYGGRSTFTAGPDQGRTISIAPRPYMHPAFRSSLDSIPELFQYRS